MCQAGQLVGAVLGTFFSTLAACIVLVLVVVLCRRRKQSKNTSRATIDQPLDASVTSKNGPVTDGRPGYESHSTLPLRQSDVVDSNVTWVNTGDQSDADAFARGRHVKQGQESVMRLTLGQQDALGEGFNIRSAENGSGIYISEVLSGATELLRSLMKPGDEVLDIGIAIRPDTPLSSVTMWLDTASSARCPVRLTLLRRRVSSDEHSYINDVKAPRVHESSGYCSANQRYVNVDEDHAIVQPTTSRIISSATSTAADDDDRYYYDEDDAAIGFSSFSDEPTPVTTTGTGPTRWRSDDLRRQSTSAELPESRPSTRIYVNDVAHPEVDDVARRSTATSLRPTVSVDDLLYIRPPRPDRTVRPSSTGCTSTVDPPVRRYSTGGACPYDDGVESSIDVPQVVPDNDVWSSKEPSRPVVVTGSDEERYVNHDNLHLQQQQQQQRPRRPFVDPRRALKDPDTSGLERALRAGEKSSRGGMAYYVNLEQHFDDLPQGNQRLAKETESNS